jgi:hypothetical protein
MSIQSLKSGISTCVCYFLRKPAPAPLCLPQNSTRRPGLEPRTAALGRQRLTAWSMALPVKIIMVKIVPYTFISPFSYSPTRLDIRSYNVQTRDRVQKQNGDIYMPVLDVQSHIGGGNKMAVEVGRARLEQQRVAHTSSTVLVPGYRFSCFWENRHA